MGKITPIARRMLKYTGKELAKSAVLKSLGLKGSHQLNLREKCAERTYFNKMSSAYKNKTVLKECYNPKIPLDKKPDKWNASDLIYTVSSPLYKHDKELQNMAKEYIKYRAKN